MLIEALCKYKTPRGVPAPILALGFRALTHPLYEDEHLVCSGRAVALFSNRVLWYTTGQGASHGFTVDGDRVEVFESVFPCTGVELKGGWLVFEFAVEVDQAEALRRIGEVDAGDEGGTAVQCKYIIRGGNYHLRATPRQLRRGIYLNRNIVDTNLSQALITDQKSIFTDTITVSLSDLTLTPCTFHSNKAEYTDLITAFLSERDFLKGLRHNSIKHCLIQSIDPLYFIFFNIAGELTVLLARKLYNYIPLYNHIQRRGVAGVLSIPDLNAPGECGMISLSYHIHTGRSHYYHNDTVDHNDTDQSQIMDHSIDQNHTDDTDHNDTDQSQIHIDQNHTDHLMDHSMNDTVPLCKFNVPPYDCIKQLSLILKYSSVVLEETPDSFWFLAWFKQLMAPLSFPGLLICPVISRTAYLLEGPFPFLVASRLIHEKPAFTCATPRRGSGRPRLKGHCKPHTRVNSILNNKGEYIKRLLRSKRTLASLPCTFTSPFLIEQYFLNEPKKTTVHYTASLSSGTVQFQRGAYLNLGDAVSLWLMLYKGPVRLACLMRKRWVSLEYLCRRACIDRDVSAIKSVIKLNDMSKHRSKQGFKIRSKQGTQHRSSQRLEYRSSQGAQETRKTALVSTSRFPRHRARLTIRNITGRRRFSPVSQARELDILWSIGNLSFADLKYNLSLTEEVEVCDSGGFSTVIRYRGGKHRLMRIEDILQCVSVGYENDQIRGSIVAYLKYFDLPLDLESGSNWQYPIVYI